MLQALNYTAPTGENVTVQRGYWYSAHENWKLAFLPYVEVPIAAAVFQNGERARVCPVSHALLLLTSHCPYAYYMSSNALINIPRFY